MPPATMPSSSTRPEATSTSAAPSTTTPATTSTGAPTSTTAVPPATTTTAPAWWREVTAEDPLRVWVIGDSLAGPVGNALVRLKAGLPVVVTMDYESGTGLASPGWECQVMIRRVDGEERWGWGVRFFVRAADRKADRSTFRCIGAG